MVSLIWERYNNEFYDLYHPTYMYILLQLEQLPVIGMIFFSPDISRWQLLPYDAKKGVKTIIAVTLLAESSSENGP